jgi:transcriptional regulator with XRE-family HTH domain
MRQPITTTREAGRLVQARRKSLGMSQESLAALSGVPQPNLSKIERGQEGTRLETILRLFEVLGMDLYGEARQ